MPTIMLVEDDNTMRSLLKTLLEIEGFIVQLNLETAQESISNMILNSNPNFLLMDVNLSGVSGMSVLAAIRGDDRGKGIRIVMASGLDTGYDCLQAGADKFLLKPYNPGELIRWLKEPSQV